MADIAGTVDFHAIRNKNEKRVIELISEVIGEYPDFHPNQTDLEDIYALTLNRLPARYTQPVTLVIEEPVSEDMIRKTIRGALDTVRARPNH